MKNKINFYIHFIPSAATGGGEKLLIDTLKNIDGKHAIVCFSKRGNLISDYRQNSDYFFSIGDIELILSFISNVIRSKEYNLIFQGWMYHGDLAASIFRIFFIRNRNIILRYFLLNTFSVQNNISIVSRVSRLISSCLSNLLDVEMLAISNTSLTSHKLMPYYSKNTKIVKPYIENISKFQFAYILKNRQLSRSRSSELRLIFPARLDPIKNHYIIFKALNCLQNFSLDLYGTGTHESNNELQILLNSTLDTRLHKRVKCNGLVSNIRDLYQQYDFIVLPSLSEGLPLSLIEASMYGLPAICSDVGDVREATLGLGLYFKNGNIDSLLDCISTASKLIKDDNHIFSGGYLNEMSVYSKLSHDLFSGSQSLWGVDSFKQSFSYQE